MKHFEVGQRWLSTVRRELEIAAVDTIGTPCGGSVVVIGYRYLDGDRVLHLRAASQAQGWVRVL